jgi:hypothetical protein
VLLRRERASNRRRRTRTSLTRGRRRRARHRVEIPAPAPLVDRHPDLAQEVAFFSAEIPFDPPLRDVGQMASAAIDVLSLFGGNATEDAEYTLPLLCEMSRGGAKFSSSCRSRTPSASFSFWQSARSRIDVVQRTVVLA